MFLYFLLYGYVYIIPNITQLYWLMLHESWLVLAGKIYQLKKYTNFQTVDIFINSTYSSTVVVYANHKEVKETHILKTQVLFTIKWYYCFLCKCYFQEQKIESMFSKYFKNILLIKQHGMINIFQVLKSINKIKYIWQILR